MRKLVAIVLTVTTGLGCATGATSNLLGRSVTVVPTASAPAKPEPVAGELIAVEPEKLWVLGKEHMFEVPLASVEEVRVQRHRMNKRRGMAWAGIGAMATGIALAAACGSVEDSEDCGVAFLGVGVIWLLLGALPALTLDKSATIRLPRPAAETLRPFARFPQGPPEGVDMRQLPAKAQPEEQKKD
jgi:hypothetical protein